jgi:hypothetical protein
VTCGNGRKDSASPVFADTEEDGGSTPPTPTVPAVTSLFVPHLALWWTEILGKEGSSVGRTLNCLTGGVLLRAEPRHPRREREPAAGAAPGDPAARPQARRPHGETAPAAPPGPARRAPHLRRSLAYGGVPVDPAFRARKASKPDLYVLADVSGSVIEFAEFTRSLLHAMSQELQAPVVRVRRRPFAFVDGRSRS